MDDDFKDARRRCKIQEEVDNYLKWYLAFAAGEPDDKDDSKEDAEDDKDVEDGFYPPSAFEFEPNPVIQAHLRSEHVESLGPLPMEPSGAAEDYSQI